MINWFRWCNSFAAAFGIAWAYTSYKYNWLNIGGGVSEFKEFWIASSGIVSYMALGIWMGALVLVVTLDRRRSMSITNRLCRIAVTFFMTPIVWLMADWFFHIGFPKSPV